MPRDEIQHAIEDIVREYAIPRELKFSCMIERIVRMKYHGINTKEVRLVIRNLLQK